MQKSSILGSELLNIIISDLDETCLYISDRWQEACKKISVQKVEPKCPDSL